MGYDKYGRWAPDESIDWRRDTEEQKANLRKQIESSGLLWKDAGHHVADHGLGKAADHPSAWTKLSEEQRFQVLQEYDNWYDSNKATADENDSWGIDLDRGITYNDKNSWDAKKMFQDLVGVKADGSIGEDNIDYASYNDSGLFRGVVDDVMEKHENLYGNPLFKNIHDEIDNTTEIRALNDVIRTWQTEKGHTSTELHDHLKTQANEGVNRNIPESKRENWQRNQEAELNRWKPWYSFDPATGTAQNKDILTGEVLNEYKYEAPAWPDRMVLTGNKDLEDKSEGIYYSSSMGKEQEITDSLSPRPTEPKPPAQLNLKIEQYKPRDRSADYLKKANHPYLGNPEPSRSSVDSLDRQTESVKYG